MNTLTRITTPIRKQVSADRPRMIITNGSLDRDRDRVLPHGGDFSGVKRGLPVVWNHQYTEIPVGAVTSVWPDATGNIQAEWKWLANDPLADRVKNAWDQGIITAASIGFLPKDSQRNKDGGFDHHAWELLEVSLCVVPSNRDAVRELKMLGLWSDKESPMHSSEEIDITEEQLRQIPGLVRDAVNTAFRAALTRHADDEIDDAEVRRFLRDDFPSIVHAAMVAHIRSEVDLAMRRLQGKVD